MFWILSCTISWKGQYFSYFLLPLAFASMILSLNENLVPEKKASIATGFPPGNLCFGKVSPFLSTRSMVIASCQYWPKFQSEGLQCCSFTSLSNPDSDKLQGQLGNDCDSSRRSLCLGESPSKGCMTSLFLGKTDREMPVKKIQISSQKNNSSLML